VVDVDLVIAHLFWDELLMFVVPVLLVLAAVRWAERRRPPEETDSDRGPGNVPAEPHKPEKKP